MKITMQELKQIIKEELEEARGKESLEVRYLRMSDEND